MLEIVQQIGAAAGCAAVVGAVGLSALTVSHAREIRRLREWAGRAPESSGRGAAQPRVIIPSRRFGARYAAVVLVGLLVVGGAAQLTGDDEGENSGNAQVKNDKSKRHGAAVKPRNVTVAVLNGTTVDGLAAALRDRIADAGFKKGMIDVYSDQQFAESVVQYAPGHQAEAKAVGRRLGISEREPATADSRALAPGATVIVIAGADKAP